MISVNQIREQLASYIANELSFAQFEDWLLAQSWNMHQDSSGEAQQLVHEIKSPMYEFLDGYIDEPALRVQLRPHVQNYYIRTLTPLVYQPSSSSLVEERRIAYS
jgi:hypothetical protein